MGTIKIFLCVSILMSCAFMLAAESTTVRRCFQFTWLGPRWNNESVFLNATCQDATRLTGGVPCKEPLVVSEDGTWPNVEYIWRNHRNQATCILADNDVCAQYTYYFDGHAENSTYMCTRAVDTSGASITSGCFEQRNGSFVTRVCLCRSQQGGFPCNNAVTSVASVRVVIFASLLIINKQFLNVLLQFT